MVVSERHVHDVLASPQRNNGAEVLLREINPQHALEVELPRRRLYQIVCEHSTRHGSQFSSHHRAANAETVATAATGSARGRGAASTSRARARGAFERSKVTGG